ncbi:hypothetical protein Tco_1318680 [Tanacetum coccineum]
MECFPMREYIWRHLYDQILNVVSKHKWEHLKELNRSHNYIPSYVLSRFVWAFKIWILESCVQSILWWHKEPNVIPRAFAWSKKEIFNRADYKFLFGKEFKVNTDLTATISELKSDWYINFRDFFMVYLPRNPPIIYNDLYEDYLNKLSASRKRAKIATTDLPIIPRTKQEESWRLQEQKMMEEVFVKRLKEEVMLCVEKEKVAMAEKDRESNHLSDQDMTQFLKDFKPWAEELSRPNKATDRVHLTDDFDIYLGQQGLLRCRFPWCKDVYVDRRFWESLVCLDPAKKGWIMDEFIFVNIT